MLANKLNLLPDRQNTIIIGDFNITLKDQDIIGKKGPTRIGREELNELVDSLDLQDTFRKLHPNRIDFTHTNSGDRRASRIDRCYVPSVTQIQKHEHLENTLLFTDHKGLLIDLGTRPTFRKSPHWKFNDRLLDDEQFRESILDLIQYTKSSTDDINSTLDKFRNTTKLIAQKFGSIRKKQLLTDINRIEQTLLIAKNLEKNNPTEYVRLKNKLEELKEEIYGGGHK